jgi:hypothetical protein
MATEKEKDDPKGHEKKFKEKTSEDAKEENGPEYFKMRVRLLTDTLLRRDNEITYLKEEIENFKKQIIELKFRLQAHEPNESSPPIYNGYRKDWSGIQKVMFILKRNYHGLTSAQVLKELISIDPNFIGFLRDPANCVSKWISRAYKNKVIVRASIPGTGASTYKIASKKQFK